MASGPLIMISVRVASRSNGAIGSRAVPEESGSATRTAVGGTRIIGTSVTSGLTRHIGRTDHCAPQTPLVADNGAIRPVSSSGSGGFQDHERPLRRCASNVEDAADARQPLGATDQAQ